MRNFYISVMILMTLASGCEPAEQVDLIVHNGSIYSINESNDVAKAMAVKDGKIVAIGAEREILNKYSAKEMLDLGTRSVIPGIIDAHCHFVGYGMYLTKLDLTGTTSWEQVLEKAKVYHEQYPDRWIEGRGWDHTKWPDKQFPDNDQLNKLFPETPVYLKRVDGHAAIANQKALELAGISQETSEQGGEIGKDEDGILTGLLIDKPMGLVEAIIPDMSESQLADALIKAQENCFAYGITTVDDAGLSKSDIETIQKLQHAGRLKMRVYAMLTDNQENLDHFLQNGPILEDRLTVRSFKFYADGALGSRGACLLEPYADMPGHYGKMIDSAAYYLDMAKKMKEHGFQMCTHCIGDSAARTILNIYGEVLGGSNDLRWRIEHAQVINKDDFGKFAEFTVIPSVQPTHATSDMEWAEKRLGKERVRYAYAYNDLLNQLQWIPLGTDFPVEDINPFATFYAAVWRKNMKGEPKEGFQTENAITRIQALRGMTIWGALSNFEETQKGSLEVGKVADFVVLDRDIMQLDEKYIPETSVLYTYLNGERVYSAK